MQIQTKEQAQQIIIQLKARIMELTEEQKIVERELFRNLGKLEQIIENEKLIDTKVDEAIAKAMKMKGEDAPQP